MRILVLPLLAAMAVSACQPVPAPQPKPEAAPDQCGAAGYQGLIGQPRTVLDSMKFPLGTRVIGPTDAITADYSAKRLNIEYGAGGLIEKIGCF